jgi:hypothetical protein
VSLSLWLRLSLYLRGTRTTSTGSEGWRVSFRLILPPAYLLHCRLIDRLSKRLDNEGGDSDNDEGGREAEEATDDASSSFTELQRDVLSLSNSMEAMHDNMRAMIELVMVAVSKSATQASFIWPCALCACRALYPVPCALCPVHCALLCCVPCAAGFQAQVLQAGHLPMSL